VRSSPGQKPGMSASRATADVCARCGAELGRDTHFCSECGTPVGSGAALDVEPLPTPVSLSRVEPHWFGVTPPVFLLGVAATVLVLAVLLVVSGRWPFGLILFGLAALLFAAFVELARRLPQLAVTRASIATRERTGVVWETWRARAVVAADVRRIHGALAILDTERRATLLELGAAAHVRDGLAEAGARARLSELDERESQLHRELEQRLELAGERIQRARLSVEDTMMVSPNEPNDPYPPPDEGTPPLPAVVPEPYPPPDEGAPPLPARVPEPSPDPAPDA
jgi:hypothetical protein